MITKTKKHYFTESGLGTPPFRLVNVIDAGSVRNGQPCNHCGTGLRYLFVIVSSEGKRSIVGSECVRHCNDKCLERQVQRIVRARKNEAARKRNAEKRAQKRLEQVERQRQLRMKWARERRDIRAAGITEEDKALITKAWPHRHLNKFMFDVLYRLIHSPARTTQNQRDALERAVNREEARKACGETDAWYGQPGKRYTDKLTCIRKISYEGAFGPGTISILRTSGGNLIKTFGVCSIKEGNTREAAFTVKKHGQYNGTKETVVTRINAR